VLLLQHILLLLLHRWLWHQRLQLLLWLWLLRDNSCWLLCCRCNVEADLPVTNTFDRRLSIAAHQTACYTGQQMLLLLL
jgi:hypothetical protein